MQAHGKAIKEEWQCKCLTMGPKMDTSFLYNMKKNMEIPIAQSL